MEVTSRMSEQTKSRSAADIAAELESQIAAGEAEAEERYAAFVCEHEGEVALQERYRRYLYSMEEEAARRIRARSPRIAEQRVGWAWTPETGWTRAY